jgi:NAD(P)-dependent dehydrogenase (short-subunit alcohol dehydrogenase family)
MMMMIAWCIYRVISVTSTNQLIAELDLEDLMMENVTSFGFQNTLPYNNSKLANSLFIMELAKRLEGTGVSAFSVCPGLVDTGCFRNFTPFRKFYTDMNLLLVGLTPEQVRYFEKHFLSEY